MLPFHSTDFIIFSVKKDVILKNFIVFEGLDGAGTTTQAKILAENLKKSNKTVFLDAEPTPSPIGELIRETYLKKKASTTMLTLALLYSADRENHLNNPDNGIKKRLSEGSIVISDRYLYSSIAYQGVNIDPLIIENLNNYESPEYVIYIDTPVDECLKRIDKRGDKKELFEHKSFLEKTKQGFDRIFSSLPCEVKFIRLNGLENIDLLSKHITEFIKA